MTSRTLRGNSGNFVEKQHAIVSEEKLRRAGGWRRPDQARVGDGVMRGAKRTQADESGARIEHARHAVNLGGLQRFFERKRRQDGGHAFRQHGFSGPRRADHQDVVTTGAGDFERSFGGLLAANVFEIDVELLCLIEQLTGIDLQAGDAVARVDQMNDFQQ